MKQTELTPLMADNKCPSFVSLAADDDESPDIPPISQRITPRTPFAAHIAAKEESVADAISNRRLNSTQIFDLYRRLDIDSNGQLDVLEFLRVAKILHLNDHGKNGDPNTDHLAKIFKAADVDNNGYLTATEFSRAYDMILAHKGKPHRQTVLSYVEAVRYGRLGEQYFVSIYTGTVDNINTFQSLIPKCEPQDYKGNLASLVDMVEADAVRNGNEASRQNIMCERSVSLTRELCAVFGLSEESDAMFLSSNLSGVDKSRLFTGMATRGGSLVHAMGIAIESTWLEYRPVVDMFPPYIDSWWCSFPFRAIYDYITPRLATLYSYKSRPDHERENALATAESRARALSPHFYKGEPTGFEYREFKNKTDFLLSDSDIRQRGKPKFVNDVVIYQLIKYSIAGRANCVLSFRQMDDYGEQHADLKNKMQFKLDGCARAHRGVLGRLLAGMRGKVIEVMDARGVSFDGQLADSSAQLLAAQIHIVHDYSASSSLSPLQLWINTLENELLFAAMTKHDRHIRDIRRLLGDITSYVKPFTHVLESHILQPPPVPTVRTQKQRSQTSPLPPGSSLESSHGSENVDEEKSQEGPSPMTRSLSANRDPNTKPGTAAVFKGTRKRAESEIDPKAYVLQHSQSVISEEEIQAQEARTGSLELIRQHMMYPSLLGKVSPYHNRGHAMLHSLSIIREVHETARESFADLLYGNIILRKKGCVDWLKRLQQLETHLIELSTMQEKQLEEQRTTYMVMSWPITFMTGYWGMNFDNMPELSEGSYPLPFLPGYKLMWFAAACVYTTIIIFVLHTKLLYGAF